MMSRHQAAPCRPPGYCRSQNHFGRRRGLRVLVQRLQFQMAALQP